MAGGADNLLAAREHRRVVVEEREPVVDVVPERYLVRYVAHDDGLLVRAVRGYAAERLGHGDAHSAEARAQSEEDLVKLRVL